MAGQIREVRHSPRPKKKQAPKVDQEFGDDQFITVPKSTFYKRTLRQ